MKLKTLKYFILIAATALLASCFPESDYMYNDTGMFTLAGPTKLVADTGDIYYITENNAGAVIPDTLKRVMASCDVLEAVSGKQNEYNVRLNDFSGAICKAPVPLHAADAANVGTDGININQAWISGGYLNLYVSYALYQGATKDKHVINLVHDNIRSNSDTLYFEMHHNAHGDSPENTDISLYDFIFGGRYASFPISDILGTGKPVIHIEWDWYIGDEYSYTREKSTHSGNIPVL